MAEELKFKAINVSGRVINVPEQTCLNTDALGWMIRGHELATGSPEIPKKTLDEMVKIAKENLVRY